jgi:protein involved in polysaccharide export with SLBB domain
MSWFAHRQRETIKQYQELAGGLRINVRRNSVVESEDNKEHRESRFLDQARIAMSADSDQLQDSPVSQIN